MSVQYAIKGQLDLNDEQQQFVNQNIGNARFVWNEFLAMWNTRYTNNPDLKTLTQYSLNNLLPVLKQQYEFLQLSDSTSLQDVSRDLANAFKQFFKNPGHFKRPRFKKKHVSRMSYTSLNVGNSIRYESGYLRLPKMGFVRFRAGREIKGQIKRVTIHLMPSGKYECSVNVVDESQVHYSKTGKAVGIDMGVADLMVFSNGTRHRTVRHDLILSSQMKYWERRMARRRLGAKAKGIPLSDAKNYQRARKQVARLHQKIRNQRKDRLHKLTTQLVREYDTIVIEDLSTSKMLQHKELSRSIAAQSWRMIRQMLTYKCAWHGKELIVVDPYKTSQVCSACGHDDGKKDLNVREWTCTSCAAHHDRDVNAAKNILSIGSGRALVK